MAALKRFTVLYEHPLWFNPLFRELETRGIPFRKVDASVERFDPREFDERDVVLNRISPSAWTRGRGAVIQETRGWLAALQRRNVDVINGRDAYEVEISKASQIELLDAIGVRAPRTRVVRSIESLLDASHELEFPLLVKPNVGGSGAGIRLFRNIAELALAVAAKEIEFPFGEVVLLQEYHRPEGASIIRVESLDQKTIYAIRIHLAEDAGFDLCPANVCKTTTGVELTTSACASGAQKQGLTVEAYDAPSEIIATVERIARASKLAIGGIEYLQSARDGEIYYYDINALSNFVADPLRVIGFDPTALLVDAIEQRLRYPRAVVGRAS